MVKETTPTKTVKKPCQHCGRFERYVGGPCPCLLTGERRRAIYQANPERAAALYRTNRAANYPKHMLHGAKGGARRRGLDFAITLADVTPIPNCCPSLGIPLVIHPSHGRAEDDSPSIDRIDNSRGYVPGNVQVISYLANRMKTDATLEQCVLLGVRARGQMVERAVQASRRGPPQV